MAKRTGGSSNTGPKSQARNAWLDKFCKEYMEKKAAEQAAKEKEGK